jgi:transcriptional regulator with XRE-family HTH domain
LAKKPDASREGLRADGLSLHMGVRLQSRRLQLGLQKSAVAAHVGVPLTSYEEFELGQAQIPATMLAELADLFRVPLFYFFQDLPLDSPEAAPEQPEGATVLTVATHADRVAALVADFQKLGWQEQQYVLMLAQALARDSGAA